MIAYKNSF